MNAAARVVCSARKYDHVTPLLRDLHWLRAPEQIGGKKKELLGTTSAVVDGTGSAQNAALDNRRPRVFCRISVEQSTTGCYAVAIITDLQEETENRTLSALLLLLTPIDSCCRFLRIHFFSVS